MMGRPSDYREEFCELAISLMKEGASITEVAAECGVTKKTLYEWMDKHPEFLNAIKIGVDLSESWWEKQGRANLKSKEFQAALWYMNMKNRFKWSDKIQTESTVTVLPAITIPVPDEFKGTQQGTVQD